MKPLRTATAVVLASVTTLMLMAGAVVMGGCAQTRVATPAPTSLSGLPGTVWHVDSITGVPTATKTDAAVSTVEFALDGRLNARDPCGNLVEGTYRVTNDLIEFSGLATSLIGCPPELTIYVALYNTRGARIEGLKLVLVDAKGAVVLEATFTSATPAPSPKPAMTSTPPWTPVPLTPPASPTPPS